jgi:hypothetical protein
LDASRYVRAAIPSAIREVPHFVRDDTFFEHALICASTDGLFRLVQSDIERVLFDEPAIHKRLDEMAAQITADYSDRELTVIAILTGTLMFMSDLLRRIPLPLKLNY